jgi:hypothetical protein
MAGKERRKSVADFVQIYPKKILTCWCWYFYRRRLKVLQDHPTNRQKPLRWCDGGWYQAINFGSINQSTSQSRRKVNSRKDINLSLHPA